MKTYKAIARWTEKGKRKQHTKSFDFKDDAEFWLDNFRNKQKLKTKIIEYSIEEKLKKGREKILKLENGR